MKKPISDIVDLILYSGPSIKKLIEEAIENNNSFYLDKKNNNIELIIKSSIIYNVNITDKYLYDSNEDLIKHTVIINEESHIVFDKYDELVNDICKKEEVA